MRILSIRLEFAIPVGHPAYKPDRDRAVEASKELEIEDYSESLLLYDQLASVLDLDFLRDLVEISENLEERKENTDAQLALKAKGFKGIQGFDQASYDKEMTEAMGLPVGTKTNSYEYRLVMQIEQLDENGRMLCTYGPEPVTLARTNDADEAIEAFHNRMEANS